MDECGNYKQKITDDYVISLYHGTSKTMQKAIIEILEITQGRKEL